MGIERLKSLEAEMMKCFRCSLCKMVPLPVVKHPDFTDACPASRHFHFHGYSGSGKQIMALSLLDGRIEPDQALARIAFACNLCGFCDVACKFIMDAERQEVNLALREYLHELGLAPPELGLLPGLCGERGGSPGGSTAGGEKTPAITWKERDFPARDKLKLLPRQKAKVAVFMGGCAQADPEGWALAEKLVDLLQLAGIDAGAPENPDPCCGLCAFWAGDRERFVAQAEDTAGFIDSLAAEVALVLSGSCLGVIRARYEQAGVKTRTRILHPVEFLDKLVEKGTLKFTRKIEKTATYHDPCYLGRQSEPYIFWQGETKTAFNCMTYTEPPKPVNRGVNGVYDSPRRILRAVPGLAFKEMFRVREYALCCGAGGGVPYTNPEMGKAAALHRIEEAREIRADTLVSACLLCEAHFKKVQDENENGSSGTGGPRLEVMDIIELALLAAGLGED